MTLHLGRQRIIDVERLRAIAIKGVLEGYAVVIRPRLIKLNLAMDCEDPYTFELFGRSRHEKNRVVLTIIGETRCRKCFSCGRRKSMFWTGRAITEYQQSARTWFGTLTLSPDEHYLVQARASVRLGKAGTDFGKLSATEQFAELAREVGADMTRYVKRLRKGDTDHKRPAIRYLMIAEVHDSENTSEEMRGRPHYHMLIHEKHAGALVVGSPETALQTGGDGEMERRYYKTRNGWKPGVFAADISFLRREWPLGHTKFQLAESANSAVYVCKYLTKALRVRVRASNQYGRLIDHPNAVRHSDQFIDSVKTDPKEAELVLERSDAAQSAALLATEVD